MLKTDKVTVTLFIDISTLQQFFLENYVLNSFLVWELQNNSENGISLDLGCEDSFLIGNTHAYTSVALWIQTQY